MSEDKKPATDIEQNRAEIGNRIRLARKEQKITIQQLEKMCDVNFSTISLMERGDRDYKIDSYIKCCLALGIKP